MTRLVVEFVDRDDNAVETPRVTLRVNRLDWSALGGCRECSITAFGEADQVQRFLEFLRYGVKIRDETGRACWWGYVHSARARVRGMEIGVTLDSMINAVAVAYSYAQPGTQSVGARRTTAWATDTDSIAQYGRKEFLSSMDGMTPTAATARRDAILAAFRWPGGDTARTGSSGARFGMPRGRLRDSGATDSRSATITCRGWWDTLGWMYASWPSVVGPSYQTTSATEQAVGSAAGDTKVMQQVYTGTQALNVLELAVYARKQAAPTDNFTLALYALDGSGNPTGSALGSITTAGTGMSTSLGWVRLALSSAVELKARTTYGLLVSRSGAADGANYYVVNVNTSLGYTSGAFKIWNGSAWVARGTDADLVFRLYVDNEVESSEQVRDLATDYGQFFSGVEIRAGSGLALPSYRDGDTLALDEVVNLLESGGANGRRLLATVDEHRTVVVAEEPASTDVGLWIDRDGIVYDMQDQVWPGQINPCGQWCQAREVLSANVSLNYLNDPTLQFVESATWTPNEGLQPMWRGQPSVEDMFKIKR